MNGSNHRAREGGLERSLGLREALAIGVGTTVGAGIFVFPGLAAGRAGPAVMASYDPGADTALVVILVVFLPFGGLDAVALLVRREL